MLLDIGILVIPASGAAKEAEAEIAFSSKSTSSGRLVQASILTGLGSKGGGMDFLMRERKVRP
jgi:hypothetical protein